jgi:hypothetical protein
MPELSRFYGIVVKMYYNEHQPPHFHAEYGGDEMVVNIDTLAVVAGRLSARATGLVMEWASQRRVELREAWNRARDMRPLGKIAPLP